MPISKSRSRSPHRENRASKKSRHRSRPPRSHTSIQRDRKDAPVNLPFNARPLSRHDLSDLKPMFALYLDIQKQLFLEDLSEDEVKGRWKSFVGKWNRGELAEGWYDPTTLEKTLASAQQGPSKPPAPPRQNSPRQDKAFDDEDDDEFAPPLPDQLTSVLKHSSATWAQAGPSIPRLQDLQAQREMTEEDAVSFRQSQISHLQHERRLDRKVQAERLDELAPKAAPGTRERQLEKRRELADSNRAFAASKDAGNVDLRDADVMGDEDSIGELKRMQKDSERKKNEREIRREEVMRARRAETDERVKEMKEKEDRTMSMLKEIARARFGGGGGGLS